MHTTASCNGLELPLVIELKNTGLHKHHSWLPGFTQASIHISIDLIFYNHSWSKEWIQSRVSQMILTGWLKYPSYYTL